MYSLYVLMKELSKLVNNQTDTYTSEYYNSRGDTHQGGNIQGSMRDGIAGLLFPREVCERRHYRVPVVDRSLL